MQFEEQTILIENKYSVVSSVLYCLWPEYIQLFNYFWSSYKCISAADFNFQSTISNLQYEGIPSFVK